MKALKLIGGGLCVAFLLWVTVSWADIAAHNNYPNPQYNEYNFFTMIF